MRNLSTTRLFLRCAIVLVLSAPFEALSLTADHATAIESRKRAFLTWMADEWKSNRHAPGWPAALATLRLARSPGEVTQANQFFEIHPIETKVDSGIRVCEALHAYYLFRDDPNLSPAARKGLLDLVHRHSPRSEIGSSKQEITPDDERVFMDCVACLLVAQLDRDREILERIGEYLQASIITHITKGYLRNGSPGCSEEETGGLIMLAEWAEDPILRRKAELGLDVLLAEYAILNPEVVTSAPSNASGQKETSPDTLEHTGGRGVPHTAALPMMHLLFGRELQTFFPPFSASVLVTSRYLPPVAVLAVATAEPEEKTKGIPDPYDSPYLNSEPESGIVKLRFGSHRLTINVAHDRDPLRIEETIDSLTLPYESACEKPDEAWAPFLNYWRLKPEQWHWETTGGKPGGCLRHEASLGVREPKRGAHDAAILLRGGEAWSDYVFEADAYGARGHFGLWVRADMHNEGGGNGRWVQGYYFALDPSHQRCRLWRARRDGLVLRNDGGEQSKPEQNHFSNPALLAEAATPSSVAHGRWLRLRVEVRGNLIACAIDNQQVLSIEDDLYPSGSVGLTAYKGQDIRFDNIRVAP